MFIPGHAFLVGINMSAVASVPACYEFLYDICICPMSKPGAMSTKTVMISAAFSVHVIHPLFRMHQLAVYTPKKCVCLIVV